MNIEPRNYFLPYQLRWISDDSPMKLSEKSRRVGYTYATSFRAHRKCMNSKNPRFTQWVTSRDMLTAQEFIKDYVRKWAELSNAVASGLAGDNVQVIDADKGIKAFIVEYQHGPRIVSLSSTPEAFAGKGGDVLIDELDLHEEQGRMIDMAMPCTTWGGQLEIVSAYKVDGSPSSVFAQLCSDVNNGNPMGWSFHRCTLDNAIADGFVEKVNEVSGKDLSREEFKASLRAKCRNQEAYDSQYDCKPSDAGGSVLSYELIKGCVVDGLKVATAPEDCPFLTSKTCGPLYLGYDIARKRDLSVITVVELIGDVRHMRMLQVMEKQRFSIQWDELCKSLSAPRTVSSGIDATGIGMTLAEFAEEKFPDKAHGVTMTAPAQDALVSVMLRMFQDRGVRIPEGKELRDDLHKVKKIVTATNRVSFVADHGDDGHADRFWSLALALEASSAKPGFTYFVPVPFSLERLTGNREEAICV